MLRFQYYHNNIIVPYPHERGLMGGAPYAGPRLGDGPIFEVSVSHLYSKVRQGAEMWHKLARLSFTAVQHITY